MTRERSEPGRLHRGRSFHEEIEVSWQETAEGTVCPEKPTVKPGGRGGRIDVFVQSDCRVVAVVEAKASDWDGMAPAAVRRNIGRQARQIWDYIESRAELGEQVSPGVVSPRRPRDPRLMRLIEDRFEEEGITVVWKDESLEERRSRA